MAEYIEREVLLKRIEAHIKQITPIEENRDRFYHDSGRNGAITGAILEVQNLPAADVAPVVHGFWESYDTSSFGGYKDGEVVWWKRKFFRCERCRKGTAIKTPYCPNCGAKMDLEG